MQVQYTNTRFYVKVYLGTSEVYKALPCKRVIVVRVVSGGNYDPES